MLSFVVNVVCELCAKDRGEFAQKQIHPRFARQDDNIPGALR